eukprot:689775-Alexandrium_andersonii.AAC.1
MSASLVGSEMCIRDSLEGWRRASRMLGEGWRFAPAPCRLDTKLPGGALSVSYTHLTLPTICSV